MVPCILAVLISLSISFSAHTMSQQYRGPSREKALQYIYVAESRKKRPHPFLSPLLSRKKTSDDLPPAADCKDPIEPCYSLENSKKSLEILKREEPNLSAEEIMQNKINERRIRKAERHHKQKRRAIMRNNAQLAKFKEKLNLFSE